MHGLSRVAILGAAFAVSMAAPGTAQIRDIVIRGGEPFPASGQSFEQSGWCGGRPVSVAVRRPAGKTKAGLILRVGRSRATLNASDRLANDLTAGTLVYRIVLTCQAQSDTPVTLNITGFSLEDSAAPQAFRAVARLGRDAHVADYSGILKEDYSRIRSLLSP